MEREIIYMKINQLEYFCAVCRYHSITRAAQKLYVTQPAISVAIRELEKEFSISLFVRSKNRLILTNEGEAFYHKASELLSQINRTASEFHELGQTTTPIRIGIPPILSTIFFPEMLLDFQEKYTDIKVELFEYGSIRAANLVREEVLDLALVNMNYYEMDKLYSFQILSDKVVFCVSKDHHLACEKEVTIEMLKKEPLIMYNTDSVQNATLNSLFDSLKIKPNIILCASQLYTIQSFIKNNLGGAFLYSSLLKNMTDIVSIPLVPEISQEIGLVWKKGKYINSNVEKYISYIRSQTWSV